MQNDGFLQRFSRMFRAFAVLFDDLGAHPFGAAFQFASHHQAHVTAADQHNTFLFGVGLTENLKRAAHIVGMGHDVGAVAFKKLVFRFRREQRAVTTDTDNHRTQRGKQVCQLAKRRVHNGAVFIDDQTQQLRPAFQKTFCIKGRRRA